MRDTPTPETDAAQHEGLLRTNPIPMQVVTANFARKLEQERDEAREQIEVCRGIIERTVIARNSALSELTDLERERDEAREVYSVSSAIKYFLQFAPRQATTPVDARRARRSGV